MTLAHGYQERTPPLSKSLGTELLWSLYICILCCNDAEQEAWRWWLLSGPDEVHRRGWRRAHPRAGEPRSPETRMTTNMMFLIRWARTWTTLLSTRLSAPPGSRRRVYLQVCLSCCIPTTTNDLLPDPPPVASSAAGLVGRDEGTAAVAVSVPATASPSSTLTEHPKKSVDGDDGKLRRNLSTSLKVDLSGVWEREEDSTTGATKAFSGARPPTELVLQECSESRSLWSTPLLWTRRSTPLSGSRYPSPCMQSLLLMFYTGEVGPHWHGLLLRHRQRLYYHGGIEYASTVSASFSHFDGLVRRSTDAASTNDVTGKARH